MTGTIEPDDAHERHRESAARWAAGRSASGRDIGDIPPIADPDRRDECRRSLRSFCETYNPEAVYLGWSDDHLRAIARIEEAAVHGALYALAMARGSGKTTLCRMAALWVLSNAICRYVFVIGANDEKATDTLSAIRTFIRFLPLFAEDYPEVAYPAVKLGGIAQRGTGQTCNGVSTLIEWAGDRIVLPTVPPPSNWPAHWPLRADGMVPTSGGIVSTSGLTGEGIRGSLKTLTTGEQVRPDFVLLDDPQTHESSHSLTQNATREQLVSADVLGMCGPAKKLAAVMPCTVISKGDFIDKILDRAKHPMWRGERSGILKSLPKNFDAWDAYYEVYREDALREPPDFTVSNAKYVADRASLEFGAQASWEARKLPTEVSAIQHAMHLRFRDPIGFASEYMNEPTEAGFDTPGAIDPAQVAGKVTNLARCVVPRECTRLTAFIDVGAHLLWGAVVAWDESFGGSVIRYEVYPDQDGRAYFSARDPKPGLGDLPASRGQSQAVAVYQGLEDITRKILGVKYKQEETGNELKVSTCLVDANWGPGTDLVYDFCRRSDVVANILPSHGKYIGASGSPLSRDTKPGEQAGEGWRITMGVAARKHVVFDANHFKSFVAQRLKTPRGGSGCLQLHAPTSPSGHQLFADHLAAEYPVAVSRQGGGRTVEEWKERPARDNHWLDCLVGAAVAASISGLVWSAGRAAGAVDRPKQARPKVKMSDLFYAKNSQHQRSGGRR